MSVAAVGVVETVPVVVANAVNVPAAGVDAPTVVPLIVPPVTATALAFWVDIVPRPETCVLAIAIFVSAKAVKRPCASTVAVKVLDAAP